MITLHEAHLRSRSIDTVGTVTVDRGRFRAVCESEWSSRECESVGPSADTPEAALGEAIDAGWQAYRVKEDGNFYRRFLACPSCAASGLAPQL